MEGAGLGLRLHDVLYGSDYHRVLNNWWENAKELYGFGRITGAANDVITHRYDPLVDFHFQTKARSHVRIARRAVGTEERGGEVTL